jgi:hypothetical protein
LKGVQIALKVFSIFHNFKLFKASQKELSKSSKTFIPINEKSFLKLAKKPLPSQPRKIPHSKI